MIVLFRLSKTLLIFYLLTYQLLIDGHLTLKLKYWVFLFLLEFLSGFFFFFYFIKILSLFHMYIFVSPPFPSV